MCLSSLPGHRIRHGEALITSREPAVHREPQETGDCMHLLCRTSTSADLVKAPSQLGQCRTTELPYLRPSRLPLSYSYVPQSGPPILFLSIMPRPTGSSLVPINGRLLFVELAGSGSPLVSLHGLGGATSLFPIAQSLAGTHTVIQFDFEGAGHSPLASDALTMAGFVEDVKCVLAYAGFGAEKAVVYGHSMGAAVSQVPWGPDEGCRCNANLESCGCRR
jgi:hypothetical protein